MSSLKTKNLLHMKTEFPSPTPKKLDLEGMAKFLISKVPKQNSFSTTIGQHRPFQNLLNYRTLKENVCSKIDKIDDNGIGSDNGSTEYEPLHISRTADNKIEKRMILNIDTIDSKQKQIALWNINIDDKRTTTSTKKTFHHLDDYLLNKMNSIYDNIISEFQHSYIHNNNIHTTNKEIQYKCKSYIKKSKSIEYINFILSKEYLPFLQNIITNNYPNIKSIHITSFFIYQIYLFTSLIFIPLNLLSQDNTIMSYNTAFTYSKQTFQHLTTPNEQCAPKGVHCIVINNNKIIKNILSVFTLTFDIPETVLPQFNSSIECSSCFEEVFKIVKDLTVCEELQIAIIEIRQTKEEIQKVIQLEEQMNKIMILICLDEIIVKYVSENNEEYVLMRPYASKFINELSKHYRIGIFTNNIKEYGDYVIESIDIDRKVEMKLYNEVFNEEECLDFGKLREKEGIEDLKKVIVIENVLKKEKYMKYKDLDVRRVIYIEEFNGDERDNQLLQLQKNLGDLIKE